MADGRRQIDHEDTPARGDSAICHPPSAIDCLPSAICHLSQDHGAPNLRQDWSRANNISHTRLNGMSRFQPNVMSRS